MRFLAIILSLGILGFGVLLVPFALLLSNRADNTGLIPIGVFIALVGLGLSVWTIRRARRRNKRASWRFLDH
jgi:hypothetical protein